MQTTRASCAAAGMAGNMPEPSVSLNIRVPVDLREALEAEAIRRGSPLATTTVDLLRRSLSRVPVKRITP
jgi:hypothetical protein